MLPKNNSINTNVLLSGYNAWIVPIVIVLTLGLIYLINSSNNVIVVYTCLGLIVLLVVGILFVIFCIGLRERKVTPDVPYIHEQAQVKSAMAEQEKATKAWGS
jgi:ABC-type polysaccharide/polyol phosphate export permease